MLSLVKELRFSVLDLSELKERRLGVVVVGVTRTKVTMTQKEGKGGGRLEIEGV